MGEGSADSNGPGSGSQDYRSDLRIESSNRQRHVRFSGILPKRLPNAGWRTSPTAWNNDALAKLEKQAHAWVVKPADTEATKGRSDGRRVATMIVEQDDGMSKGQRIVFHRQVVDVTVI